MKLSELIAAHGDDAVQFQNLDECMISANYTSKSGQKITFGTPEVCGANGTERLGLIVWLDRDRVSKILATSTPAGAEPASRRGK